MSTQFGITNLKNADQFILQSQTPINFSTSKTFIESAYNDPNGIFSEIHQKLKGQTVYKIVREKYSNKLEGIENVGDFNKNKRKISTLIKSDNVTKLDIMAKNLPSFYDALSQTDSYFQAEYRQKFSEYGHSKDESLADEIMQEIQRYFQAKMDEGNKIKNGESLFEDDYPFMQEYTPQLYNGNEDDGNEDDGNEDEELDWGGAISKLKK